MGTICTVSAYSGSNTNSIVYSDFTGVIIRIRSPLKNRRRTHLPGPA